MLTEHTSSQCGLLGSTGKSIAMINVPQVLVVHISRFDSGLHKIDHYVMFPQHLTTDHIPSGYGQSLSYRLRGVIEHVGSSIDEGHYIAYVFIQGDWFKAEDRIITPVSWHTVSKVKAYILMYEI